MLAAGAAQGAAAPQSNGPLQFDSARLGMGLSDWKGLPAPGDAGATTACSAAGASVVCGYVAPDEEVSLPLVKTYRVRRPQYTFVSGTLSKIEFHTSIDAFNDVMAMLEAKYGPATQVLRDSVDVGDGIHWPRVRELWRLGSGTIELTDPAKPASQLAVAFQAGRLNRP